MSTVVLIDTETGGTNIYRHPVIQVAAMAVRLKTLEIESEFEVKVHFDEKKCDPEALEHNSYDAIVWQQNAEEPKAAMEAVRDYLNRYAVWPKLSKKNRPYKVARLAGYNVDKFDRPMLHRWFQNQKAFFPADFYTLDLYQRAIWYFSDRPDTEPPPTFKLGGVCRYFGIEPVDEHDATGDCLSTLALWQKLRGMEA